MDLTRGSWRCDTTSPVGCIGITAVQKPLDGEALWRFWWIAHTMPLRLGVNASALSVRRDGSKGHLHI